MKKAYYNTASLPSSMCFIFKHFKKAASDAGLSVSEPLLEEGKISFNIKKEGKTRGIEIIGKKHHDLETKEPFGQTFTISASGGISTSGANLKVEDGKVVLKENNFCYINNNIDDIDLVVNTLANRMH